MRSTRSRSAASCSSRPATKLYEGMVIGENAKPQDLEVNPLKSKQLTNFRASGPKDEGIRLTPPRRMTLEQAIAYIQDDELVEVTPKAIRIRKRYLDPHERKRTAAEGEARLSRLTLALEVELLALSGDRQSPSNESA